VVVDFIAGSPFFLVVVVVEIKLTNELVRSNFSELVFLLIIVAATAFTLLGIPFTFLTSGRLLAFWRCIGIDLNFLVEFFKISWRLARYGLLFKDPVTSLLEHPFLDVVAFNCFNFFLDIILLLHVIVLVFSLPLPRLRHRLLSQLHWIILNLLLGFGGSLHAQEDHLFFTHLLDDLASDDTAASNLD